MKVIVYKMDAEGRVAVIIPAPEFADHIEAIAARDVPDGAPWRIMGDADLPSRDARDQWRWTDSGALDVDAAQ